MPTSMTQDNQTYYLHYDQVGTLRLVTDINNNIIKEVTYDTFGNILHDTNINLQIPFGFAGGMHDRDTKLVHFGYREYDTYTGKWSAKDPIGFDGGDANLYGYVLGDPVNFIDPTGEIALLAIPAYYWLTGAGIAGVGATAAQPYLTDWLNDLLWDIESADVCEGVDKNKEPNHPDFTPHKKKKGLSKIPWNKSKKGWPAKNGDYWLPVPDGHKGTHDPHWDVQHPGGKAHTPTYPQK